ncbi:MAG TPA: hypothetical protein VH276_07335 [Solirubrobacteraceae bacterium]|jgi:hypothetical protein|nr:hypothetical protein [Solirubrobacteraceae bacterium]
MARDLIPPPSPAGRPSTDPHDREALAGATPEAEAPAGASAASAGPSPFRSRFGFILGGLLGILACAGVAFALLIGTSPRGPQGFSLADHWSNWEPPTADPTQGAVAIAEHIGGDYRFNDGKQLVGVEGQTLQYQSLPLAVALRSADGSIHNYGSDGLLFTLRGQGKDGRLIGEKPSKARHALLRREALELALYSFRYLDGITEVVTLLPPAVPSGKAAKKAKPQLQAVYYRPGDLKPQLESPLDQTLDAGRLAPDKLSSIEKRRIDALTMPNLFLVSYQLAQNQLPYLVLDRPSTSG